MSDQNQTRGLSTEELTALLSPSIPDVLTPPPRARSVFGARGLLLLTLAVVASVMLTPYTRKTLVEPLLQLITGSGPAVLTTPFLWALLVNLTFVGGLIAVGALVRGVSRSLDDQLYTPESMASLRESYLKHYAQRMTERLSARTEPLKQSDVPGLRAWLHQEALATSDFGVRLRDYFGLQCFVLCLFYAVAAGLVLAIRMEQASVLASIPDAAWVLLGLGVIVALAWGLMQRREALHAISAQLEGGAPAKAVVLSFEAFMLLLVGFGMTGVAVVPEPETTAEYDSAELAALTYVEDALKQCLNDIRANRISTTACDQAADRAEAISLAFQGRRPTDAKPALPVTFSYETHISSVTLQAYTLVTPDSEHSHLNRPAYRIAGVLPAAKP